MEREGIGTKARRADVISTLIGRGYMEGSSIEATDLGLSIVEIMMEYSPQIISTSLTRETEKALEDIENGVRDETELIERSVGLLAKQTALLKAHELKIGDEISWSAVETATSQSIVGPCPICKTGSLRMIRSSKTRKRFVGCTNYIHGCRASAPLPQKGTVIRTSSACGDCGWLVVYVRYGRRSWRLCLNMQCKSRGQKKPDAMQALQKKS